MLGEGKLLGKIFQRYATSNAVTAAATAIFGSLASALITLADTDYSTITRKY
jgi:hypothetical protein